MFTELCSDGFACDAEMRKRPEIRRPKEQVGFLLDRKEVSSTVEQPNKVKKSLRELESEQIKDAR